jgi:hypothetical protein
MLSLTAPRVELDRMLKRSSVYLSVQRFVPWVEQG